MDHFLSSKSYIIVFDTSDNELFARDKVGKGKISFTAFKHLKNWPKPTKILFNEQFLLCATVVFPILSPCITEFSVVFYILSTGYCVTSKGLLSIDNVGTNLLILPRAGFKVKKTNEKN